jgi:hypothetical protein
MLIRFLATLAFAALAVTIASIPTEPCHTDSECALAYPGTYGDPE